MKQAIATSYIHRYAKLFFAFIIFCFSAFKSSAQEKLRVVVAGLNHDHVHNIMHAYKDGRVMIVGIAEPSKALWKKYAADYQLPDSLFSDDLESLVKQRKPDAVLGYNEVSGHLAVVQTCAPLHVPVMVEKPLAATLQQAQEIEKLSKQYNDMVLVNLKPRGILLLQMCMILLKAGILVK